MSNPNHQLQDDLKLEQKNENEMSLKENNVLQVGEIIVEEMKQPKMYKFTAKYWITDFILRFVVLLLWKQHYINEWIFWIVQIAIFIYYLSWASGKVDVVKKKGKKVKGSGVRVILLGYFLFAVSGVVNYTLFPQLHNVYLKVLIAIPFSFLYYVILFTIYGASFRDAASKLITSVHVAEKATFSYEEKGDINDLQIIDLENKIKYLNSKVDTYVLESALFGALTFGGFLTLISADRVKLEFTQLFDKLGTFQFEEFFAFIDSMNITLLLNTVVLESLICTLFFLSVIASRLRFSDSLEHIDLHVRAARSLNEKEEEILNYFFENEPNGNVMTRMEGRLKRLNDQIEVNIIEASSKLKRLGQVITYMKFFRNAGIVAFLMTIITGSLLISQTLAVIFSCLSLAAFLYSNIDHWVRIKNYKLSKMLVEPTTTAIRQLSKKGASNGP